MAENAVCELDRDQTGYLKMSYFSPRGLVGPNSVQEILTRSKNLPLWQGANRPLSCIMVLASTIPTFSGDSLSLKRNSWVASQMSEGVAPGHKGGILPWLQSSEGSTQVFLRKLQGECHFGIFETKALETLQSTQGPTVFLSLQAIEGLFQLHLQLKATRYFAQQASY